MRQTNQSADTLAVCLMNHAGMLRRAVDTAGDLELFDSMTAPSHALVWEILCKLQRAAGEGRVTHYHLSAGIREKGGDQEVVKTALELVDDARALAEEEIVEEIGNKYFEEFRIRAVKRDMLRKLSQAFTEKDMVEMINHGQKQLTQSVVSDELVIEHPLMDPVRFMPTSIKLPTGVRWLDYLSFGGHSAGETVGILGPTGGGKTVTATELLMSQAWRYNHSLLVLYEQPLSGDIAERIYCQAFGDRDVDFFRETPPAKWSDADKVRYRELRDQFGKYVNVVDFSKGKQGLNGVADIAACVDALIDANRKPTYVIVDWLWPAIRRFCIHHSIPLDKMRAWASNYIDEFKQLNATRGTIGVVFHQLNTEKSRASPSIIPVVTDAYELRDFAFMLDAAYVIGNRDKNNNVMWLGTDKNRRGQPQSVLGHLDGAKGHITLAKNMVFDARAGFIAADQVKREESPQTVRDSSPDPYF